MRNVRLARKMSCARNFRAVARIILKFVGNGDYERANTFHLNDDHDPKEKAPTAAHQDPMFSMLQNVNKILGAMADSILNLNQSIKRLHPSNADDQFNPKRQEYSSKDEMSVFDGSDDD